MHYFCKKTPVNTFVLRIKNPKIARRLRKTIIWLFITIAVLGSITAFIGYYYEDTVKNIIINELNKRLNTEIVVENVERDIQFSVFRDFPYASVTFYNVMIMDAVKPPQKKGKLLEAKSVSLQFNIWDIIFGTYEIKKIAVNEARAIIKIYKNRSDNYHFWKPPSDTVPSKFSLGLQKVLLNRVSIHYLDYKLEQDFKVFAGDVVCKGRFSDADFTAKIMGDMYVYQITSRNETYLSHKGIKVDVGLWVNNNEKYVEFREGTAYIGTLPFGVLGKISYADSVTWLDLSVEGKKMKLQSFINELPPQYRSVFEGYDFRGDFVFKANIKGYSGMNANPLFMASFSLNDGSIIRESTGISLNSVNFSATFTNGSKHAYKTSVLNISSFSSTLNEGSVSGSIMISNFVKPHLNLNVTADLNLNNVFLFVKADTVESASGRLQLHAAIKGEVESKGNFTMKDFIGSTASGTLTVVDAALALKGGRHTFTRLNGSFEFNHNDIEMKNFSGNYGSSDFAFTGSLRNMLPFLFLGDQKLTINAQLESKSINFDELLDYSANKKDTVYQINFPDNIQFNLDLKVHHTSFRKFTATDITGNISLKNKQLIAKDVSLRAVNGKLTFTGLIDGSQTNKLLISCDAAIDKVNIQRLFAEMGNFHQKSIEDKNIKGVLTATVQFASIWSAELEVEKPTIYAKANIKIENGELNDYEPLKGLSKYLKNRDLSHVSFQTMTNTIEIRNQLITIPKMEIKSSAISFNMNGTHGFDQTIDYSVGVLISQLRNKGDDHNDQVEGIGQIVDDDLHKEKYFFRITGTVNNPIYHTFDKYAYKSNIKINLKNEKETMKELLNREFGWFKKDTIITKNPKDKYDFNVIWDEDEPLEKNE